MIGAVLLKGLFSESLELVNAEGITIYSFFFLSIRLSRQILSRCKK